MRKFKPLMNKLIIKIVKEKKTNGGIIIPDNSLEHNAREEGIVQTVGTYCFDEDDVKPVNGDIVAIARYGGKSLGRDENDDEWRVIKDIDVLCIIEE